MAKHVIRNNRIQIPQEIKGPLLVKAGFPAGQTDTDIVDRAIWNHYGTSRGIPPRPFMLNAIRKNRRVLLQGLKDIAEGVFRGETTLEIEMTKLGAFAQGLIQKEITDLKDPPNAPATIKAKGSSNPLIDSGEMRAAVTWKVER